MPSEARPARPLLDPRPAWQTWASGAVTFAVIVGAALIVLRPLLSRTPWMLFEEDDFFYYLQVARNLDHGFGSTFNALVLTNGYHPLWFLVLAGVSLFASGKGILAALGVFEFAATLATFLLSRALLLRSGLSRLAAAALAVYVTSYAVHLFYGGMEVILTIPLLLAVVLVAQNVAWWQRGFWPSSALGLFVAAMVLSRLDSILFAAMLLLGLLLEPRLRSGLRAPQVAGLALGLLPLAAYFALNERVFHVLMPISGSAKQLKASHLPAAPAWVSLFGKPPAQLVNLVPILLGLLLLPLLWRRLNAAQRVLYPVLLAFPFVHLLIVSCFSDWKLWGWYFYAFRPGLLAGLILLGMLPALRRLLDRPAFAACACLCVLPLLFRNDRGTGGQDEMFAAATDLRDFALLHPGVYAMGDRSGMPGYLMPRPLVQTEGLMMDRAFLESIRQGTPLRAALAPYHVRYYIGTAPNAFSGCFEASEPYQAGPQSPHMRATFCEPPAAIFQHGTYRTLVYDLARPPAPGDN